MNKLLTRCAVAVGALFLFQVALAYESGAAGSSKITGKVAFKGAVPASKKLPITKDNAVCGTGEREIVEVNAKGGNLAGAVVYIAKIDKGKAWGESEKPVLDQKGCRFTPGVMVVKKDADLTIRNSDPVLHNIHTYEVECDAHDFMHAWAFTAENPYAAVTKEDGTFTLDGLPDGTYEVKAWHPVLGEKSATVTVKGAAMASFEFSK